MEDSEEGYGDPHEGEESEGEDVQLEQEDVGVSLGTTKGKGIMHGCGSSATTTRKRRGANSWVEEEPAAILDENDLDFLNVEGVAKIVEEGEAGGSNGMLVTFHLQQRG
ncbi:hypothetical protein EJ110_NYTH37175 [Nymphaea thermarum]|nr:hypothetical protein EJ110_NYTH37175 [Nymphaea thermarum]